MNCRETKAAARTVNGNRPAEPRPLADIVRDGHRITVQGPKSVRRQLAAVTRAPRCVVDPESDHPGFVHEEFETLFPIQEDVLAEISKRIGARGHRPLRPPLAGLTPLAVAILNANDCDVQLREFEPIHRVALPEGAEPASTSRLTQFALQHERGLITLDQGCSSPIPCIARFTEDAPLARVGVVAASEAVLAKILRELRDCGVQGPLVPYYERFPTKVHLDLPSRFRRDVCERDVFFFPDALDALHERSHELLASVGNRARLFGFLPAGSPISRFDRAGLAGAFGFEELTLGPGDSTTRPVTVEWISHDDGRGHVPFDRAVLRTTLHHLASRNRRLLAAAGAAVRVEDSIERSGSAWGQAVVLVHNVEHAVALLRLRRLRLRLGCDAVLHGLSGAARQLIDAALRRLICDGDVVVATIAGLEQARELNVHTIVWGGASPFAPALPRSVLWTVADSPAPLRIVDVADRWHPELRRWVLKRQLEYQRLDWRPAQLRPAVARVERLLSQLCPETARRVQWHAL